MSIAPGWLNEFVEALERGERFDFDERSHELARQAIARKATRATSPDDIEKWVERLAAEAAEAGEADPCGCAGAATECDYHLGWWDGYAAATATNQPSPVNSEDRE